MRFLHIFLLLTSFIIYSSYSVAQSYNYGELKSIFSKLKTPTIEGFFELNSDRKYVIAVIKNRERYQVIYLFGNAQEWKEGDIKGFIKKENNTFIATWDDSVIPGTIPEKILNIVYDINGFSLKYPNDSPDYFRKINLSESDLVRNRYLSDKSIKMIQSKSGIFEIPATINNVLKIYLILDTGASDVSISPDVVLTLLKAKAIDTKDWLEGQYYQFADGSIAKSKRFVIRYLKIGDFEIKDVEASISNSIEAPLLLGQSALSKLGKIQIDYKTQNFKIVN